jgi:predicted porin
MQVKRLAAALVAATPLFAVAQTNVTLYGVVDAAIESADEGGARGRVVRVQSGDQSTSRIGFRGTEDLGNGLKAIFNLEAGIAVDTGTSDSAGLFQRRAVVGLEGSFGTVTLGREYSPIASVAAATDEFGQGFYGSNLSAFGNASPNLSTSAATSPRLTRRLANSVNYKTATFGGFKLLAAYAAGENTNTAAPGSSSADLKSVGAEYTLGNLYVGAAYAEAKRLNVNNDKEYAAGAAYKFDQLGGLDIKANYMVADAYGPNNKFTQWNVGAGFPFGASKVLANFQQNKLQNGAKGKVWAVAYTYSLSKRTNLYASYADMDNNRLGTFTLNSSGNTLTPQNTAGSVNTPVVGGDPSAFTIGIRHTF